MEKERSRTCGTITQILREDENTRVLLQVGEREEILLWVSTSTPIIDSVTGLPLGVEHLKKGETVWVTSGSAMALSQPSSVEALAIVAHVDKDKAPALFLRAGSVIPYENGVQVNSACGEYRLLLSQETEIRPYRTKNMVSVEDVVPGSDFFAWFDVMTLSLPAQAVPSLVVLLPSF